MNNNSSEEINKRSLLKLLITIGFSLHLIDTHAFTGVVLTVSGFACPATKLLETALTPAFTGGELPRN
jgi:hypothetical protein